MPIVSSEVAVQIDLGHLWFVVEHHVDDAGVTREWRWTPTKSVDPEKFLAEHAAVLEERVVAEAERAKAEAEQRGAVTKLDTYLRTLPDETLKSDAGLTDEELAAFKEREAVRVARG